MASSLSRGSSVPALLRAQGDSTKRSPVLSRMKQTVHFARLRIDGGEIGTLSLIAERTAQGQVSGSRFAAMLRGDDVIHFVAEKSQERWNAAILASAARSGSDFGADRRADFRHPAAADPALDTPRSLPSAPNARGIDSPPTLPLLANSNCRNDSFPSGPKLGSRGLV